MNGEDRACVLSVLGTPAGDNLKYQVLRRALPGLFEPASSNENGGNDTGANAGSKKRCEPRTSIEAGRSSDFRSATQSQAWERFIGKSSNDVPAALVPGGENSSDDPPVRSTVVPLQAMRDVPAMRFEDKAPERAFHAQVPVIAETNSSGEIEWLSADLAMVASGCKNKAQWFAFLRNNDIERKPDPNNGLRRLYRASTIESARKKIPGLKPGADNRMKAMENEQR